MLELLTKTLTQTVITVAHTWPYLAFAVLLAAVLKVHVEPARLRSWLARHQGALTIARWRVLTVVVVTLWVGAIASGYVFDALVAGRLF
jgi:uncharacterized membrane protein YraQ (UPF0718 family)